MTSIVTFILWPSQIKLHFLFIITSEVSDSWFESIIRMVRYFPAQPDSSLWKKRLLLPWPKTLWKAHPPSMPDPCGRKACCSLPPLCTLRLTLCLSSVYFFTNPGFVVSPSASFLCSLMRAAFTVCVVVEHTSGGDAPWHRCHVASGAAVPWCCCPAAFASFETNDLWNDSLCVFP